MNFTWETIGQNVDKIKTWNPLKSEQLTTFKYIDLGSLDKDKKEICLDLVQEISSSEAPSRARQLVKTGDVLISTVRPNLNGIAVVPKELDGTTASTGFCVLRANEEKLDSTYLRYWVESTSFVSDMVNKATGASYPAVSDKIIHDSELPLPPLETQKKIAAVLEKADQLRKDCQQMEQELNSLSQSVFIEMFGDPVTNPKGWKVATLSTIVDDFLGGKSLVAADDKNTEFTNRVLKISAVTSGEFKPKESKPLPNDYIPQADHFISAGDLLFSRANTTELVGATTMVFDEYTGLVLPDKLWRFIWKDKSSLSPIFIWRQLCEAAVRKEISKLSSGSGGSMKNISKGKLKTLPVVLPPLKLQKKFELIYMNLREQIGRNKQQLILSEQAFSSLMQKAFNGELQLVNAKTNKM
ncbi:restriction endonuclease subunit S [Aeromonas veronii]|uniref:restriction endonuclease subunit S n=1 Tax=Aeromonas veronii TaxID=654 RepID=UPI000AC559CF|nr:restriction endonuclease subunit S [Aeromonas veronii]